MNFKNIHFVVLISIFCLTTHHSSAQTAQEGFRFMEMEQFSKAGKVFESLASSSPTAENLYNLGLYYMKLELFDSTGGANAELAKTQFEKGTTLDPKYPFNYVGLGSYAMFKGDKAKAKEQFDKAIQLTKGKNADVLYRVGEAYSIYPTTDHPIAIQMLDMAGKMKKTDPEVFMTLGDAFLIPNEGGPAADNYDKAIRVSPNSAKPYIRSGNLMIRAKNYSEALKKYKEGLAKDSTYSPGFRQLGELYFRAGQFDNAVNAYKKYISMSDQRPEMMYRYGAFLFLNKNYTEAYSVLSTLTESKNTFRFRLLAYCNYEMKQYPEGLTNLENFLSKIDTSKYLASDYEYYGKLLLENGKDTTVAIQKLFKAVEKDTSKIAAVSETAKKFFDAKKYLKSAELYELVLAKGKKTTQDYFNLANSYFFGKEYVKADTLYGTLIQIAPTSALAYLFKARAINFRKLDPDYVKGLAKPYYEKFVSIADPKKYPKQSVEAYLYLGSYYALKKDVTNAHAAWNKLLEIDPANQKAKDGLLIK